MLRLLLFAVVYVVLSIGMAYLRHRQLDAQFWTDLSIQTVIVVGIFALLWEFPASKTPNEAAHRDRKQS